MKKKQTLHVIIALMPFLLWSCLNNSQDIQVRYAEVSGLQHSNPVYFDQNKIGRVEKITYTKQGDYLVQITINPEFKNAATVDSEFYIDDDPMDHNRKAVIVVQKKPGGAVLDDGAIVEGSVKSGFFSEMMKELKNETGINEDKMRQAMKDLKQSLKETSSKLDTELENTLDDLSQKLQEYKKEVKKIPDSEEMQQLQNSVKQFAKEFNKAKKDVREHLRNEVLPQLQWELDQLREKLKKEGREQELDKMDKQIKEMDMV